MDKLLYSTTKIPSLCLSFDNPPPLYRTFECQRWSFIKKFIIVKVVIYYNRVDEILISFEVRNFYIFIANFHLRSLMLKIQQYKIFQLILFILWVKHFFLFIFFIVINFNQTHTYIMMFLWYLEYFITFKKMVLFFLKKTTIAKKFNQRSHIWFLEFKNFLSR